MRLHAYVKGRVQNVGYRYYVRARAEALGLDGWVKNLPDGRVEVEAFGSPEALDRLVEALHEGPAGAWVQSVDIQRGEGTGDGAGFHIMFF
ncbi:MAG: acylphosphatase [Candidatus Zipacnadales bacterium]